jgi:hypothetical protein
VITTLVWASFTLDTVEPQTSRPTTRPTVAPTVIPSRLPSRCESVLQDLALWHQVELNLPACRAVTLLIACVFPH